MIPVPMYAELSSTRIWNFVKEVPDLLQYFPDFPENMVPDREYLFTIISTLRGDELKKLIKKSRDSRSLQNEDNQDKMIEITKDIKDEIFALLNKKSKHLKFIIIQQPKDELIFF